MTSTTVETVLDVPTGYWTRERRTGAVLAAIALIGTVVFALRASNGPARFFLGERVEGASFSIDGKVGAIIFGVLAIAAAVALLVTGKRYGLWVSLSLAALVFSAMCWLVSARQGSVPLSTLAVATVSAALPLIYGSLSGVLCERTAVVNVAIEGQLLTGAFLAALVGTVSGSWVVALIAAAAGGVVISALLAVLSIKYLVDQVVAGIVLNFFALGLTGYLYEQIMQKNQHSFNDPEGLPIWKIPGLSEIPIIGPALFRGTILTYTAFLLVIVTTIMLFRTRWGLRTRAVGEHPAAADTVGIRVLGLRYLNVLLAGVVAGFGGAYFSMMATTAFTKNITGGAGFIALAAMIFGRWHPVGAFLAALFFGFAGGLSTLLQILSSEIPSEFLAMLPYVATILAVAGLVGRVRAPAADGKPYVKG
jgi:simple sugar transport system permease protein